LSGFLFALALATAGRTRAADVTAAAADDLDARHRVGIQLGGSAFGQVVYRVRLLGHSYLELGGGGLPHGVLNGSAGLVVARSTGTRVYPYAAAGIGFGLLAGYAAQKDAAGHDCPSVAASECAWDSRSVLFGYSRVGIAVGVDASRKMSLSFDVGAWYGDRTHSHDDGLGKQTSSSTKILWPMAGVGLLFSF
jgi:hypothetical protein